MKSSKKPERVPHLIEERMELLKTIEEMVKKEVKRQTKGYESPRKILSDEQP